MNTLLRSVSHLLASIRQHLQSLKASLNGRAPQRRPVLVPIPIQSDRRMRGSAGRHPYRGG